jgi:7-keto-8-aminopelargonate synthetase-like enzyme/3-oxoacyl-(acyl-carrier-protein) synthase/acyl carrier protein
MPGDPVAPIAIIGMAGRFAGADDLEALWDVLISGRDCFGEVPPDRWPARHYLSQTVPFTDRTYTARGAYLGDVRDFAALHFGIPPVQVQAMDPQHRLVLEVSREALIDAGIEPGGAARRVDPEQVGVFLGISVSEYSDLQFLRTAALLLADDAYGDVDPAAVRAILAAAAKVEPISAYSISGNLLNMAAANVASRWGFAGPAYAIDAACASSLVAVHDAVLHLRAHQCDVALAGGTYLNLTPTNFQGFTRIGAMSRKGRCRPFDADADGFLQGEGCGVVVLKRLEDVLRDGDPIRAVIRGTGTSNDGASSEGPMAPSVEGEALAIRRALDDAAVHASTIGYVECHGTGTPVGDPVEVAALAAVRDTTTGLERTWLSSIKANIGHTMSAAGIAGLIKTVMVLERGVIPPLAGYERPNPSLVLGDTFAFPTRPEPWPRGNVPRRAGVSAFGFGGTNCHVVLEEAPVVTRPSADRALVDGKSAPREEVFVLCAADSSLLAQHAREIAAALERAPACTAPLRDVAYTLGATRRWDRCRLAVVASDRETLIARLIAASRALDEGAEPPAPSIAQSEPDHVLALYAGLDCRPISLPAAPLERTPHWLLNDQSTPLRFASEPRTTHEGDRAMSSRTDTPPTSSASPQLLALLRDQAALLTRQAEVLSRHIELLASGAPSIAQAAYASPVVPVDPPRPAPIVAPPAHQPVAPTPTRSTLLDKVMKAVSDTSGFPRASLRADMRLDADIGLDSVALAELAIALEAVFPGMKVPDGQLAKDAQLGDLVLVIEKVLASQSQNGGGAKKYDTYTYDMFLHTTGADTVEMTRFHEWQLAAARDDVYAFEIPRTGVQGPEVELIDGDARLKCVNLSSYNYLGYGYHPEVIAAAKDALDRYGLGAASSPVISGTFELHRQLEHGLLDFFALPGRGVSLFSSGYAVNTGVVSAFVKPGQYVVLDRSLHMSLLEGAQLSKAHILYFRHNDPEHLDQVLRKIAGQDRRILVCAEGVYSADGDFGALARIVEVSKRHGAKTLVDEAHSVLVAGPNGRGVAEEQGVLDQIDLLVITFSKALGGVGGAVIARADVAAYINWYARCRMFSCAMDPAVTGGVLRALQLGGGSDGAARRRRVIDNASHLRSKLAGRIGIGRSTSWIVPAFYGPEQLTLPLSRHLQRHGLDGSSMQFPAVPKNESRMRLFVTSEHTHAQLDRAAEILVDASHKFGFAIPPIEEVRQ